MHNLDDKQSQRVGMYYAADCNFNGNYNYNKLFLLVEGAVTPSSNKV